MAMVDVVSRRAMAQVRRLDPKVGSRLALFCIHCVCCGLTVGSALERISIDLALPGGVSFLRADGVSPA